MAAETTAGDDHGMETAAAAGRAQEASSNSTWEIEEEAVSGEGGPPPAPATGGGSDADDVYVAVGKSGSSMAALRWALDRVAKPHCFVYLVHVFPVVTSIPTPLGRMSKSQATPEQVETYMNQERAKRRALIHKFLDICRNYQERAKRRALIHKFLDICRNYQVQVDTLLIESDHVANAVLELIPVLNIKCLVVGTSKSDVRKLKRGSTIAGQIQKNAPLYCDVKVVCDGKELSVKSTDPTPPFSPSPVDNPTPPSSTPTRNNGSTNGDGKESRPKEKKKVPIFLRCFSF